MKFYTNVFQIGNSMLVRGYDNGKHFEDRETFHPTFYVPSKRKRSKWKTLDGQLVDPVKPYIREHPYKSSPDDRALSTKYFKPASEDFI